jgi:hypothetical protein
MKLSSVGLLFGSVLGLALVLKGFPEMLVVALVATIGWVIAKVIEGDLDVADIIAKRKSAQST